MGSYVYIAQNGVLSNSAHQSSSVCALDWCITIFMSPGHSASHSPDKIDTTFPFWERTCIAKMDQGRPDAFNPLVEYYSARIYAHLYRMVGNREEAEDLTQETFVRAYRKIDSYDRTRPFRNWLYTIATNIGRNAARSKSRRIPSALEEQGSEVIVIDESGAFAAEIQDTRDRLAAAVNQLPDPLHMLIQLHYQEGLTIREAAQVLNMSESAAKVALHRARKTLRTKLQGNDAK